jgi:uncharacterized Ntn-hydrolase superfamily protein
MTWSIIAKDPATGQIGIAVTTCAFAVGARVPFIASGVGAIASQAFVNPFYGSRGLELLKAGASANDVIKILTRADDGRADRQVHIMDTAGRFAAYTGDACIPWAGSIIQDHFSVAGNMLAGPRVIEETARVFGNEANLPFARRLLNALVAGQAAGGDKRGKQSAAILTHDKEEYPLIDIRVDDHPDPLTELARLEEVSRQRYIHFRACMPSQTNPFGVLGREEIERCIAESVARAAVEDSSK